MVKVTTLVDNNILPNSNLVKEHGFSCLVEKGKTKILFDTGCGKAVLNNAKALNVDLSDINHLVISHGHYDHSGGVRPLLETHSYEGLKLWTGLGFENPKFSDDKEGLRFVGIDFDQEYLSSKNVMWYTVGSTTAMIEHGIWVVTKFKRFFPFEQPNERFLIRNKVGQLVVDEFCDEIALVVDSPKGLIMIVGCSHPGILNMIQSVRELFAKPIYGLIGGIHLYDVNDQRRKCVIDELLASSIKSLGTLHCTGKKAIEILKEQHPSYFENVGGVASTYA
ncbi:MAG: MBL fold metallo-hydrolase [Sphaerochaetaceae bacterium]